MEIPDEKTILEAIKPFLKEREKERDIQDEISFHGSRLRRISFLRDVLTEFFEQDIDTLVEVEPVWKWLQAKLKEDIKGIVLSLEKKKWFLEQLDSNPVWDMESVANDYLDDLETSLDILLQEQHRERWRNETLPGAFVVLNAWNAKGLFVALLDKEGKLLAEPYPVTTDSTAKVKVVIEDDAISKRRKNIVARFDKPIQLGSSQKVNAIVLCEAPAELDKFEVIKL